MPGTLQSERKLAALFQRSPSVGGKITGAVVAYGETGNLITDIANDRLAGLPTGQEVTVLCDEHQTVGIFPADHPEEPFTFMAIRGLGGFLELTIIGESAKAMLGVPLREKVTVKW